MWWWWWWWSLSLKQITIRIEKAVVAMASPPHVGIQI
jgi:hypothetical protein